MALLSVPQLREHIGDSSLSDDALQRLLEAAELAIVQRFGELMDEVEYQIGGAPYLALSRRAASIVSIVENGVTLDPSDYALHEGGAMILRLDSGPNPASIWSGLCVVTFSPYDDTAERIRVQLALVKLDIQYSPGLASQTIGTWSESYAGASGNSYAEARKAILASLYRLPALA